MKFDNHSRYPAFDGKPIIGKTKRFYARFIQPGDLVFDLGANIGRRTDIFVGLGARVVAVEPLRENIRSLFAIFHDQEVQIVPRAAGAAVGHAEITISTPSSMASTLNDALRQTFENHPFFKQKVQFSETRPVKVTTLDALIAEHGRPTFIKIDVEGHEPAVFQGLSHPLPALSFEFLTPYLDSALACFPHLDRLGRYVCNYAVEEKFDWMLDEWVPGTEMITILHQVAADKEVLYGDVYVKFLT